MTAWFPIIAAADDDAATPPATGSNLGRLHGEGLRLKFTDGRDYNGIHLTGFREFELWLRWKLHGDQAYGDQLQRWQEFKTRERFTGARVFSFHKPPNRRPFDPREFGSEYYPGIGGYLDYQAEWNQRVRFCVFAGAVPPDDPFLTYDAQYAHLDQCLAQCRPRENVELEEANEGEDNGMPPTLNRFPASMFAGVLACRTRILYTGEPVTGLPENQLDWLNNHPERKGGYDGTRKFRDGELITRTPGFYKPLWFDEPEKAAYDGFRGVHPEMGIYVDQYGQGAACARLFSAGLTVHGDWDTLQSCQVPSGEVLDCCRAAVTAWYAGIIPSEAQEWNYARDEAAPVRWVLRFPKTEEEARAKGWTGDAARDQSVSGNWEDYTVDPTGCKHAYAMISPDGRRAGVVNLEPGNQFILEAKPGWTIVRADPTKVSVYLEQG